MEKPTYTIGLLSWIEKGELYYIRTSAKDLCEVLFGNSEGCKVVVREEGFSYETIILAQDYEYPANEHFTDRELRAFIEFIKDFHPERIIKPINDFDDDIEGAIVEEMSTIEYMRY